MRSKFVLFEFCVSIDSVIFVLIHCNTVIINYHTVMDTCRACMHLLCYMAYISEFHYFHISLFIRHQYIIHKKVCYH